MNVEILFASFVNSLWPSRLMIIVAVFVVSAISFRFIRVSKTKIESKLQSIVEKKTGLHDEERFKRLLTLAGVVRFSLRLSIVFLAFLIILSTLGVDLRPLFASAGIVGVAVGFGAQSLIKDFFSGFFLIIEDQIRVGDVVNINGTGGLVEKINFRTVVLRGQDGALHIIPNGSITQTTNLTKDWSAAIFEIGVSYNENPIVVMDIMREVAALMKENVEYGPDILEDIDVQGLERFDESSIVIKARLKTRPMKQWIIAREYRRILKELFDKRGIEIPFPHRKVIFEKNG